MTDSDKITIAGIVVNAIMISAGWFVSWRINKNRSQATLPLAKPEKKRYLTVTEKRFLRNFRLIQIGTILLIVYEPFGYFAFNSFPPASKLELLSAILSLGVMIMFSVTIIFIEKTCIRQVKSGEFMKRLRRNSSLERKKK